MADDVSNTTIAVLLILTILVSVIGTWTVLDTANEKAREAGKAMSHPVDSSYASMRIIDPATEPAQEAEAGSYASLTIK